MPEPFIRLEDVHYFYRSESRGAVHALNGVDLAIERGEYIAILGHNGSGKSTLAKHLNALLLPSSGRVLIDGMDTRERALTRQIRQTVGIVFQNPDNQIVATVVEEDVAFGPENLGLPSDEIRRRVDQSLEQVELTPFKLRAPHLLSGGQKQRVAVAGVLAMQPQCLVLDEATAMLDPSGRREVLDTVARLHREGHTVVAVTHFMHEALEADRVVAMADGQVALEGTPREVFRQGERLRELDLDVPPMGLLAERLRARGLDLPADTLTVDEMVDAVHARAARTVL